MSRLTSPQMAHRLSVSLRTLMHYRQRGWLREGQHFERRGPAGRPWFFWSPEVVEQTLAERNRLRPRPVQSIEDQLGLLVSHLLERRHRLQDVAAVDCLALAQLVLCRPAGRVPCSVVAACLGSAGINALGNRLRRLRDAGLIEYEPGTGGGYQFLRIGPLSL